MNITKISTIAVALTAALSMNASRIFAADAPATPAAPTATPAPAQGGNNGGGPGGNAQDFRARMNDRIKTALKASDDEWTVIQPLIEKVFDKQRAARGGGFGGPGGFGGRRGGQGGDNAATPAAPSPAPTGYAETQALKEALDSDATTPDVIKAKLAALREARKKAQAELDQAREDLKKVLTLRQEATLVNWGLLD